MSEHADCAKNHEGAPDTTRYYKVFKGETCENEIKVFQYCEPINGDWSEYEESEEKCSDKCMKKYERTCTNPEPKYDGETCKGENFIYNFCDDGDCNMDCFEKSTNYPSNDIKSIFIEELDFSILKCQELCQANDDCIGFAMDTERCWLKDRLEGKEEKKNCISGPKYCKGKTD